jgi:hypothetical protein
LLAKRLAARKVDRHCGIGLVERTFRIHRIRLRLDRNGNRQPPQVFLRLIRPGRARIESEVAPPFLLGGFAQAQRFETESQVELRLL